MKLKPRIWILFILIIFLAIFLTLASYAQEEGFVESFDDPSLPGWEVQGTVYGEGGVLVIESGGEIRRFESWGNYSATLRAMFEMDVIFRIGLEGGTNQRYLMMIDGEELVIIHEVAGQEEELGATPFPIQKGKWFELGWSSIDGIIQISLNGINVIEIIYSDPIQPGGLSLSVAGNGVVLLDDLVVRFGSQPEEKPPDQSEPLETSEVPPKANDDNDGQTGIPAYQNRAWVRTGGPIGGLGYDIRYNFEDHNIWYVTDAWAGIHMSTDRGLTWFPNNQGITARKGVDGFPIFSATVDPHNPNIIWIGTQSTGGIFKSTDGGYSWVKMADGIDESLIPLTFRGFTVDPRTSNIVYAMAEIGSLGWTPNGIQLNGLEQDLTMGIVYKTTNGGENWSEIWRGNNLTRYCWIDPRDPNVLYISTGIFDREAANTEIAAGLAGGVGILKSTDGGETWRVLNQDNGLLDLYVSSLYMHPENPDMLLAAASENNWSYYGGQATAGVFLTENGGETWERVIRDEKVTAGGFGELFSAVEYCESDPSVAYAASDRAIYRSEDAGHTWQSYQRADGLWGPDGIIPGFPIDMQCDPEDPMRIFINNYLGGNFLSTDGGESWMTASQGYSGAQVRSLAVDPDRPGNIFAGSRTGVFRNDQGGKGEWIGLSQILEERTISIELNEISKIIVHPEDSSHIIVGVGFSPLIAMSHDHGNSWDLVSVSQDQLPFGVTGLSFAPSDPSIVYLGLTPYSCLERALFDMDPSECAKEGAGVYISQDSGSSWTRPGGKQTINRGILSLAVHPHDSNTIMAATYPCGIVKTTDGGRTWIEKRNGLSQSPIRALAFDPVYPNVVYAGVVEGGVYRSSDGGDNWMLSSAGMDPNAYITSIVIDPNDTQIIYAADLLSGVYLSSNGGNTWTRINEGLDHRTVNVLSISSDGTVVYAGVEGAGVYRLGTPPENQTSEELSEKPSSNGEIEDPVPDVTDEVGESLPVEDEKAGGIQLPCLVSVLPLLLAGMLLSQKRKTE